MAWILATARPSQHDVAFSNAARMGFKPVLLKHERTRVHRGRKVQWLEPVFGSYFFVEASPAWPSLLSLRGVRDVVRNGEEPVPVPDRVIDSLTSRLDERGLFIMPKHPHGRFRRGTRVAPSEGPLRGIVGIYEGATTRGREEALFTMLGCTRRLRFEAEVLVAA